MYYIIQDWSLVLSVLCMQDEWTIHSHSFGCTDRSRYAVCKHNQLWPFVSISCAVLFTVILSVLCVQDGWTIHSFGCTWRKRTICCVLWSLFLWYYSSWYYPWVYGSVWVQDILWDTGRKRMLCTAKERMQALEIRKSIFNPIYLLWQLKNCNWNFIWLNKFWI